MKTILIGLLSLLVVSCATSPSSPNAVADSDIADFKYGIELGCKDDEAKKGKPRSGFCDCVMESLDAEMTREEWQQAFIFDRKRRSRDAMAILAPHMLSAQACKSKSVSSSGLVADLPSIIGTWTWKRRENSCSESYAFRPDGTVSIVSGDERTEGRYTYSRTEQSEVRALLTLTTTADYGGRDCADSKEDSTGQSDTVYVLFNRQRTEILVCGSVAGQDCFGPLRRQ